MPECICPDPWRPEHATCGACGGEVIILDPDDPAFCPACDHDVMPAGACARVGRDPVGDIADAPAAATSQPAQPIQPGGPK